jgi:XapX domain-containing protein
MTGCIAPSCHPIHLNMKPYLVSLAVGLAVGLLYNAVNVRSPAPPTIALVGLLGMLAGEHAITCARSLIHHFAG